MSAEQPLTTSQLETLLEGEPAALRTELGDIHPEDVADVVRSSELADGASLIGKLPAEYAAQVFERLEEDLQEQLAERIGVESMAQVALEMSSDERADFLSLVPTAMGRDLLDHIELHDPEIFEEVEKLTQWPDTSAGGLMTTDFISISQHVMIRDAIEALRRDAGEAEAIDAVFVKASDGTLSGVLPLRRMLLAEPGELVASVMNHNVISVPPQMDQEEVARKLAKYDLSSIPVVGERGGILGVITSDDILDVLTEEQSEDVQRMGAIEPLDEGYFNTSFRVFLEKRAPWLFVLFFGGLITTQTLQTYEHALSTVTQLSFYLPLLISAGGNSGAQSSTLIIRGLAVGNVKALDWKRILKRETLQGVVLGTLLALVGVARALIVGDGLPFALLIGCTIVSIVVLGCVAGAMTPLVLHRAGVDPATSSTPFIATVVDVVGIIIYLSLARAILGITLSIDPGG
jgi:magnesium transporter